MGGRKEAKDLMGQVSSVLATGSAARTAPPAGPLNTPDQIASVPAKPPSWVQDSVFYQIFPDRFANGDEGNDPFGTVPWGSAPTNDAFMGGDLMGINQKLGYLKSLGVDALYLNPIFKSPSNHKYDVTDYENVDPTFGGNKAFTDLVDSLHGSNMKIMLDGVFNHTSHQHSWFRDIRDHGPSSKYSGFYDVWNHPIRYARDKDGVLRTSDYKSWWGYATLPELQTQRAEVRDYFIRDKNSIMRRWVREGKIDGWRMDVADEVEQDFWQEARVAIKQENPNAYMLAENWHDASDYLKGDQFDAAMNYRYFQQPATDFFARKGISSDQFVERLKNNYSTEAKLASFNLLGSHDTPRFITEAGGDWYRMRPAAIFQMTYQGAPVVYYGDEIGMEGGKDPGSRGSFEWSKLEPRRPAAAQSSALSYPSASGTEDTWPVRSTPAAGVKNDDRSEKLLNLYRTLISVRKREPALRRGDFEVLSTHNEDSTITYRRSHPGANDVLVALNNNVVGKPVSMPVGKFASDGTKFRDELTGKVYSAKDGLISLPEIDGNFGAVLVRLPGTSAKIPATAQN